MIELLVYFIAALCCYGCGIWSYKRASIDYKARWQQALKLLEQERLGTQELDLLDKPRPMPLDEFIPNRVRGRLNSGYRSPGYSNHNYNIKAPPLKPKSGSKFVKIGRQAPYRALNDHERYDLELARLKAGQEPRDAFGGCKFHWWVKGRKMQLEHGWDFIDNPNNQGWKKVK